MRHLLLTFSDVLPSVEPGYLLNELPEDAPEQPEDWKDILKDFNQAILPGVSTNMLPIITHIRAFLNKLRELRYLWEHYVSKLMNVACT